METYIFSEYNFVQPGESQTDISEEHIASIFRIEEQAKE
jgi:hypothetical protein